MSMPVSEDGAAEPRGGIAGREAAEGCIALLGVSPSAGNRGVQALGTALLNLINDAIPGSEVVLLANHHRREMIRFPGLESPIPVVPARLSPRAAWQDHLAAILLGSLAYRWLPTAPIRRWLRQRFPWIDTLARARMVGDIRGGDSFSDLYGIQSFLTGFFLAWTALLVRREIAQLPQTFGPYRSPLTRALAAYLLRRSPVVLARDRESLEVARRLVGDRGNSAWCPDVAFALPSREPGAVELDGEKRPWEHVVAGLSADIMAAPVGMNINGLMYNGGYNRRNMFGLHLNYREFLPRLIQALLRRHQGELWLIPHTYDPPDSVESDPEACRQVQVALPAALRPRVRRITAEYDCTELKAIIGRCGFFVGSRMHSCIAALSQGVPCVGIAYSRKFRGVFDTVGMKEWVVDARQSDPEAALNQIEELYARRWEVRKDLVARAEAARNLLKEAFREPGLWDHRRGF